MEFFGFFKSSSSITKGDLISPFSLSFKREGFCQAKTELLYKRILDGCYSRSEGAEDKDKIRSLFDSFEKSNSSHGLISILAEAMRSKAQVAIVYDAGVARKATSDEQEQIKKDYKDKAKSSKGVLVDFTKYYLTDLIYGYMSIIYDIMDSMNTQVGLAKALQIKINSLRATVSVGGKDDPIAQAKVMNEALKCGESVLMDKNDTIETLTLNSDSVKNAISLVNAFLAADLGMSLSFINGELTTGMSATGEADANKDEYGFLNFFNSIFKPTCDALYSWNLQFITDDWRYTGAMLDKLIIVENSSILSDEQKQSYAERTIPISNSKK